MACVNSQSTVTFHVLCLDERDRSDAAKCWPVRETSSSLSPLTVSAVLLNIKSMTLSFAVIIEKFMSQSVSQPHTQTHQTRRPHRTAFVLFHVWARRLNRSDGRRQRRCVSAADARIIDLTWMNGRATDRMFISCTCPNTSKINMCIQILDRVLQITSKLSSSSRLRNECLARID